MDELRDWLQEKPGYIDIIREVVAHEENADDECYHDEHEYCWNNTDISCHPTKLYQLEIHGVLDRTVDTNSGTKYKIADVEMLKDLVREVESYEEEGVPEVMHEFPDEDDLPDDLFDDIVGYEGAKFLIRRGLTTDDIVNFLLVGEKGSGKTVFLLALSDYFSDAEFIPATDASSAGFIEVMFQKQPRLMLLDELDDMDKNSQKSLSSYTETGIVKETKYGKSREMRTNAMTIATANTTRSIMGHIQDRFEVLEFDKYPLEDYIEVCINILPDKGGVTEDEAEEIAKLVWDSEGYGDVRRAIRVARLSRGDPEKVMEVSDDYSSSSLLG